MTKLSFQFGQAHTGDVILALPVIEGAKARGYETEVVVGSKYYKPLAFTGIPRADKASQGYRKLYPRVKTNRHRTEDWLASLKRIGLDVTPTRTLARPSTVALPKDYILLQPWCEMETKRWQLQHWAQVAAELKAKGRTVVVGAPSCYRAECVVIPALNYAGKDKDNWEATVAGASLVISVDSGALHMADLLGKPSIGLYGCMPSSVWAPFWNRAGVIQASNTKDITVEQVMEKVSGYLI